jgi:hypothetical protein
MGAFLMVFPPPGVYFFSGVFQGQEPVLVQAFLTKTSIESLNESIVGGLPRPTEIQLYSVQIGPLVQPLGGELWPIVQTEADG